MHQLDRIEDLLNQLVNKPKMTIKAPKVEPLPVNVDPNYMSRVDVCKYLNDMFDAMATYRKVSAIKAYRELTGVGLKESKDAIEKVMNNFRPNY